MTTTHGSAKWQGGIKDGKARDLDQERRTGRLTLAALPSALDSYATPGIEHACT